MTTKGFEVKLNNPKDTPEQIAEKLNTLTYAIDASVIRGGVDKNDYEDLKKKTTKFIETDRQRIDTNDLRWHGAGLSKVIHDGTLTGDGTNASPLAATGGGSGTVTSVSVVTANGVSGSVATPTVTPAITLTLGAITPTTIIASGNILGSNLSGTNTGDQTNISGNAATVTTNANLTGPITSVGNATTVTSGATFNLPFGINLTGAKYINVLGGSLATGNSDLYTTPSNKRAFVLGTTTSYQASGGNIVAFLQFKTAGGTYYQIGAAQTISTGTTNLTVGIQGSTGFVLEPNEIISVNTTTNPGLNMRFSVIEFDSTNSFHSPRILIPASGDNTVYTVPIGKSAFIYGTATDGFTGGNSLVFFNSSGGSITIHWNIVPNGGSAGSTNEITASASVTNASGNATATPMALGSGDFVSINLGSTGTASLAWINAVEM